MPLRWLNSDNAYIFRITHRDNLTWILDHGLHARNSSMLDPNFRKIGDGELIDKRRDRRVPTGPGGTLSDYVPFYFTPFSTMAYKIHTGHSGIERIANADLVILFTSLHKLSERNVPFVFTDGNAYSATTQFFTDLADLSQIDWTLLQNRAFKHDPDDPRKFNNYLAEALARMYCPIEALLGIGAYGETVQQQIENELTGRGLKVKAYAKEGWYFR